VNCASPLTETRAETDRLQGEVTSLLTARSGSGNKTDRGTPSRSGEETGSLSKQATQGPVGSVSKHFPQLPCATTINRFLETGPSQPSAKFQGRRPKGDLELRTRAIDQLGQNRLKESLEKKVDNKIGELEKRRAPGAYSELREQVQKALATSQSQLQSENRQSGKGPAAPPQRGAVAGEKSSLRRVVELAGMLQYCDFIFVEQETIATEESRIRPDFESCALPRQSHHRRRLKKFPFDAFYESISTTDEEVRSARLKDHARLGAHPHHRFEPQVIFGKTVQPTPEFCAALFLPGETFYSAALGKRSETDRRRRQPGCDHRDAYHADRFAQSRFLRLATGADGRERSGSK